MDYFVAGTLALLLLAVVAILAIFRWEYGLALTLASLSLVNRLKTEFYLDLGYVVVTAETIFILLLLMASQIRVAMRPRLAGFRPHLFVPISLLLLSGILSLFNSLDTHISVRLLVAGVIQPVILFYLLINNLKSIDQVRLVIYALIASALLATVYGIWQVFLTFSGRGNAFDYRIVSVYYSPAIFGEILLLSYPLVAVTRMSMSARKSATALFLDVVLASMIAAMLMTITRSVWLGLVVSLAVLTFDRKIRSYFYARLPFVFVLLLILVLLSGVVSEPSGLLELFQRRPVSLDDFSDRTTSIGERIFAWQTAVTMMMDNPTGIGLDMFSRIWPRYRPSSEGLDAAHNLFLDIGVQMGILALVAFLWIVLDSVRTSIRLVRTCADPDAARLGLGILSALAGYFVHATFGGAEFAHNVRNVVDPLGSPISTGMSIFWSLVGCLYILDKLESAVANASA